MAPLSRDLPPWRWVLGQHLCTPPVLGPRKLTNVGRESHCTIKENQGTALHDLSLQTRPAFSTLVVGSRAPGSWGFLTLLSSGQQAWNHQPGRSPVRPAPSLSPCFLDHSWFSQTQLTADVLKGLNSTSRDTGACTIGSARGTLQWEALTPLYEAFQGQTTSYWLHQGTS